MKKQVFSVKVRSRLTSKLITIVNYYVCEGDYPLLNTSLLTLKFDFFFTRWVTLVVAFDG